MSQVQWFLGTITSARGKGTEVSLLIPGKALESLFIEKHPIDQTLVEIE
jgi:hypothetical protein